MAQKRIRNELKFLEKEPCEYCSINPSKNDLFTWKVTIVGPPHTPYESGKFLQKNIHLNLQGSDLKHKFIVVT